MSAARSSGIPVGGGESLAPTRSSGPTSRFVMGVGELEGGRFVVAPSSRRPGESSAELPSELVCGPMVGEPQAMALWVGACARSRAEGTPVRFEYERASLSGSEWVSVTVAFLGDRGGPARFAFLTEGLIARKRADEALREADRSKGDIIATLGHSELHRERSPAAGSIRSAGTGKNRVLVVDDNSDFARASAHLLSLRGYEVAVAHDGPSALETALRFEPHVCLLDVGLPVMDGYELARRLRQLAGPTSDLRLVAITGYGQETDRLRSEEAGFHAHLVKPISWEVLSKVMSFR